MDFKDVTDEVIDTSDTEEKELLEAQKPGYHQRVWGHSKEANDLRLGMSQMEVDSDRVSFRREKMAQLEPRTPSHKRLHPLVDMDPSPVFSRLHISSQDRAPPSSTPAATPVRSTSISGSHDTSHASESSGPFSSPLGALHGGHHKPGSKLFGERPFVDDFDVGTDFGGSPDPISFLTPVGPKRRAVSTLVDNGVYDRNHDSNLDTSPTRSTSLTLHSIPRLSHGGPVNGRCDVLKGSSPPLEFPWSPGPDSLVHSPGRSDMDGASQDTISLTPVGISHSRDVPIFGGIQRAVHNHDSAASPTRDTDFTTNLAHNEPANNSRASPQPSPDLPSSPGHPPSFSPLSPLDRSPGPERNLLRSMSPLTPPPPSPRRNSVTPSPVPVRSSPPIIIPPDSNPPARAYVLRERRPVQINPFGYEKRMYKLQLKGMPEAIVKNPTVGREGKRKERYREGSASSAGGEEESWKGVDEGDDGDEEWRRKEKRRENQKQKEAVAERMRELGLVLSSSEEEDLMEADGRKETQGGDQEKRGKKRKRMAKVRKFPMVVEPEEPQASSSRRRRSTPSAPHAPAEPLPEPEPRPRPRPRPRPVLHRLSPDPSPSTPPPPRSVSPWTGAADCDFNFDAGMDDGGPVSDVDWPDAHGGGGRKVGHIPVEDEEDAMVESRGPLRRGHLGQSDSDVQMFDNTDEMSRDSSGEDQNEDSQNSSSIEMTERDRKRLKALGRMMPAAHARKLLRQEQEKARQKDKDRARRQDTSEDEEEAPLQPGHGRKRIVSPNSRDLKRYEIKGDTETETESQGDDARPPDREVIVVDDDGSEEDAERVLEESDDGIDDDDIQTWLAPGFRDGPDHSSSAPPYAPRVRRPDHERDRPRGGDLIDRMLQRTSRVRPRDAKAIGNKPKVRGPRNPTLDVVTREARRHGASGGRQTKLAFPKVNGEREPSAAAAGSRRHGQSPSVDQRQEHHIQSRPEGKKKRDKRGSVQTGFYIAPANGRKIISGRGRQIIHFDDDDDAFHEVLAPAGHHALRVARPHAKGKAPRKQVRDVIERFRAGAANACPELDTFDVNVVGGPSHKYLALDFDIPLLPSGIAFGPESYVGKGRLYDLIAVLKGDVEAPRPLSLTVFGQEIEPNMPIAQISSLLPAACDNLYDASTAVIDGPETPLLTKAAEATMHSLCQIISFRASRVNDEEDALLAAAVCEQTEHLVGRIDDRLEMLSADGHTLDPRSFALYWFVVELRLRLAYARSRRNQPTETAASPTTCDAERYLVLLLRRLLEYGLDRTMRPLQAPDELLDVASADVRTLELWACVLHLAPLFQGTASSSLTSAPSFWRLVDASVEAQSNKPDSQLDASERIWRTLFSLCAISQFSVHGLTTSVVRLEPYWPMVSNALKCIRLIADEQLDQSKPAFILQKRDAYVRLVTSRCFLLCVRWHWRLNDADGVFRDLCAIFRSRRFSNLLGEPSDFPTFIRDRDEALFHVNKKGDTAFGLFLKLVVRSAKDFQETDDTRRIRKLDRLLGLAVPVGSTTFTKSSPPIGQELSMLYNRYSAIIVAIYVDPTPANIRTRLQQVRRYINFKDADCNSRAASIRAMMNLAIFFRHLNQPLDDVLLWASEMMIDLVDSYKAVEKPSPTPDGNSKVERDQVLLSIQLLVGSIRVIIETSTISTTEHAPARYPDPVFLQGAWISRVFSHSLDSDHRTGLEVRKCVQSFLAARSAVIAPPPLPRPSVDRQESQDEYGDVGLDLNDPAVLALLSDLEGSSDENYLADKRASEIFADSVSGSIYRMVCRHFGGNAFDHRLPGSSCHEGDQWVECWVGCASVVVRHKRRDWTWYFDLGRPAWDSIRDMFWRRRMCLRFTLTVLQLDPTAYTSHAERFLDVWFESIVSPVVTIEHEFTARLLSVDGGRHLLFQNGPCVADPDTGIVTLELLEFEQVRLLLIDAALCNIAEGLERSETAIQAAPYIPLVEKMLNTLRECLESMSQDEARRSNYAELCKNVFASTRRHAVLMQEPRLRGALNWGNF